MPGVEPVHAPVGTEPREEERQEAAVLDALGGGLGAFVTGTLFDLTGSYRAPFALIVVLLGLASICAFALRNPPAPATSFLPEGEATGEAEEPSSSGRLVTAAG